MGMGARDYNDLQRSKERASSRGYRWARNSLLGIFGAVALLTFDTHNSFARDMVQRVTGSPMQSVPYIYRLGNVAERTWNQVQDFAAPYMK